MGIVCQGCQGCERINLLYLEEDTNANNKLPEIYLPKQNIHNIPNKSKNDDDEEAEEKILIKFDSSDKEEEKDKESHNTNSESQYTVKKKYSKPKVNIANQNKLILEAKEKGKDKKREYRSHSQTKQYAKKEIENLLNEKITVNKAIIPSKSQNINRKFKRKSKKSTTLMENANVIKKLFNIQMSIPVSQELLVVRQKGNPSDKYIRGRKIGSGSYGTVYEAKNLVFNNIVAMKVIAKHDGMDNLSIKNEIDILKKLSHPNIVRIYEFYESENNFYLINELCNGGELFNFINKSTLNEQQLSVLFYQVFSGLCYLHENNILHRDIKPENILISSKEKDLLTDEEYFWIQIIDFGTAKIFEGNKNLKRIVGSSYYIAPEVLKHDYNEKCDTWSVGVILYMFLAGKAPFDGSSNEEIINSIKTKTLDLENENLVRHSDEVRDLVKGLLNKNIEERLSAKQALSHKWFKKFNGRQLFGNFMEKDIQQYINNLFNYTFHSKIQQLVIAFLVHNLPTTNSSRNILKLYRYFNISGDCKLTKDELIKGLSKYRGEVEVRKKVDHLFILLDGDNNGFIEYEEFLRACIDKKEILNDEYLKYAFKFLDRENRGNLTVKEISNSFLKEENKLFEIAISKDINDVDQDGDGNINFNEFKQLMTNTMY